MKLFAWYVGNEYEPKYVVAMGETVNEARRAILDRAEKLFQYAAVSPSERKAILAGDKEVFQYVADKRQEWNAQLQSDISLDPREDFEDGTVFLS